MTTANDIILGALKFINQYAPGESLSSSDAQDALGTLNDLLGSFNTDQFTIYASNSNVFTYIPGQYEYTIGNYDAGQFAGTVTNGSPTITLATVPSDMVEGGDLTGTGIPEGTTIVSFTAFTVTMSANATASPGPQQISYTIPGDFKMERPLRITNAFTRIYSSNSGLDYPMEIVDQRRYVDIGFKGIQAPWPILVWYNPTFPLGTLSFYQNPSQSAEVHLYTDLIINEAPDLTTEMNMPQGYTRFLKRAIARELAPEYGSLWTPNQEKLYKEAYDFVKALNATPTPVSNYDANLIQGATTDAGWILYGGFRN